MPWAVSRSVATDFVDCPQLGSAWHFLTVTLESGASRKNHSPVVFLSHHIKGPSYPHELSPWQPWPPAWGNGRRASPLQSHSPPCFPQGLFGGTLLLSFHGTSKRSAHNYLTQPSKILFPFPTTHLCKARYFYILQPKQRMYQSRWNAEAGIRISYLLLSQTLKRLAKNINNVTLFTTRFPFWK